MRELSQTVPTAPAPAPAVVALHPEAGMSIQDRIRLRALEAAAA